MSNEDIVLCSVFIKIKNKKNTILPPILLYVIINELESLFLLVDHPLRGFIREVTEFRTTESYK